MKKLEDYKGQKIAIRCKTDDEIRAILKLNNSIMDSNGVIQRKNEKSKNFKFAYRITDGWDCVNHYKEQGYTILPATDFLEDEFIYGQEYEFSEDNEEWHKRIYLCKTPNNIFIAWNEKTKTDWNWKYARKINTERTEAITTIKELVSKFSINQNEVF